MCIVIDTHSLSPPFVMVSYWKVLTCDRKESGHLQRRIQIQFNLLETAVFVRKIPLKTVLPAKFTSPVFVADLRHHTSADKRSRGVVDTPLNSGDIRGLESPKHK
ncbi:hypothetical protein TNCV_2610441 [Trichonephila clavipes]|nr:hypothetical protein TNCV_2610441 [Trichonephila clavipes]